MGSYNAFMKKYPEEVNLQSSEVDKLESWHTEWFEQEQIIKTPTWFVNGYKLPQAYRIEDLMGLAPGLADYYRRSKIQMR
jgi:hypothetical protein